MMLRVLWIAPPVAALCTLLPNAQLATIERCPDRIVLCTPQHSALVLPKVSAAGPESAAKPESRWESCVVLPPVLPYGWDFGAEVTDERP